MSSGAKCLESGDLDAVVRAVQELDTQADIISCLA